MELPFTVGQFLGVFTSYNEAVWPIQIILNGMALSIVFLALKQFSHSDRSISLILGLLWLWTGLVYHMSFFAPINPAAFGFGAMFVVQGLLFIWMATRDGIRYRAAGNWKGIIGSAFVVYGLLVYPILGHMLGHVFPASPTFGAPCPTTIFTFGILLWAKGVPRYVLIIPALWSLIGSSAAVSLGIQEDFGLLVAGVVGTTVMITSRSHVSVRSVK